MKEYYFYLDSTPTHSYMRYLYKYPQAPFPYADLVETNRRRSRADHEYELIDTGVFDDDRYFDVFVEYAKAGPEDLLIEITAFNRGPEPATLHLLPTLWFRNIWRHADVERPVIRVAAGRAARRWRPPAGRWASTCCAARAAPSCCSSTTRPIRSAGATTARAIAARRPFFFKDGINEYVIGGREGTINPRQVGTKAAAHYTARHPAGRATRRCACA